MSEEKKVMNRNLVVIGAVLIQLALGAIYAWSAFTGSLIDEYLWKKAQTQIVFSVGLVTFALVMVVAGQIILPKIGPQKLAMSGGVVLGIGYILAGIVPITIGSLVVLIGIIGGAGIGLGYVVPIGVGMKWFPDKKGMITGLAVAGFGFGATIWVKMAGSWGHAVENLELQGTFILYGILFMVMVVAGGYFMVNPPEGWLPEGYTAPAIEQTATGEEFFMEPKEMIKTPQYFMILVTFIFSAMSGLMAIGLAKIYPKEALVSVSSFTEIEAAAIAGTAIAIFFSLANGIGRIAWGLISDKIGVKKSIFLMALVQGITMILFQWMAGVEGLLYLGATIIGFNFGGNFALFPGITAATFGKTKVSANYGWVFLAYGFAGIVGPILGGIMGDAGQFAVAFTISGILTLVAAFIIFSIKPLEAKVEAAPKEE